jgi:biopolymer transport protein ExbD
LRNGRSFKRKKVTIKKFESINVVPFIDIMLVLLVIVLTTATFVAKGVIPVELPSSKSAEKEEKREKITITIKQNGDMFFDLFVALIDVLKQKNYNNIGIITHREGQGARI